MEQKRKNKSTVTIAGNKKSPVNNAIKKEIINENDTKTKIIVISLIIALILSIIAYAHISKDSEDKEEKNKKNDTEIVDKRDDESDIEEDETAYSNDYVVSPVAKKRDTIKDNQNGNEQSKDIYYAITFETNGGKKLDKQILTQEESTYSVEPTKEGWIFDGWYVDSEYTEKFNFGNKLNSDVTIYAKWVKNVRYEYNDIVLDIYNTVTDGEIIPLLAKEDLNEIIDDFEIAFYGRHTDEYENVEEFRIFDGMVFDSSKFDSEDTIVLKVVKLAKFELSFYKDELSENPIYTQTVVEGDIVDFALVNQEVKSKELSASEEFGWYYLDNDGIKFDFAYGTVANPSVTKLYLSDVYVVIYNELNDEQVFEEIDRQNVSKDSKITDVLNPEEKENKKFDGWYLIDSDTNNITDEKLTQGTIIDKDISVVSKWIESNEETQILIFETTNQLEEEPEENEIIDSNQKTEEEQQEEQIQEPDQTLQESIPEEENKEE